MVPVMAVINPKDPSTDNTNTSTTPAQPGGNIPGSPPGVKWIETEEDARKAAEQQQGPTDPALREPERRAAQPTTPDVTHVPSRTSQSPGHTSESDRKR